MKGETLYKQSHVANFDPSINSEDQPIRVMIVAMLERAVKDAGLPIPHEPDGIDWRRQARVWLRIIEPFSEEELFDPRPYSFAWCSYALGCNPLILQKRLVESIPRMQIAHGRCPRMILNNF